MRGEAVPLLSSVLQAPAGLCYCMLEGRGKAVGNVTANCIRVHSASCSVHKKSLHSFPCQLGFLHQEPLTNAVCFPLQCPDYKGKAGRSLLCLVKSWSPVIYGSSETLSKLKVDELREFHMDLRGTYLTGKQITKKILLVFSNGDQRTFLQITCVCVCV